MMISMVRSPPSELSFASCMLHDLELRMSDSYDHQFLVDNVKLRCEKYLRGLVNLAKERKQPVRESVYAQRVFDFITARQEAQAALLLDEVIILTNDFLSSGRESETQTQGGE
jgi:hypothetical protein